MQNLVDSHILSCKLKPSINSLYINTGIASKRIFQNGFDIEQFTYQELMNLAWIITRVLKVEISDDHFMFWSWCGHVTYFLRMYRSIPMPDWFREDDGVIFAFRNLINLVLLNFQGIDPFISDVSINRYRIAGPLSFAILEGLLRRKNRDYVNNDGSVIKNFSVTDSKGNAQKFDPINRRQLNRINFAFKLFETETCKSRGRGCSGLQKLRQEIMALHNSTDDAYDLIDSWRNDLVHGKEYWLNKVALILNLICLLMLDEVGQSTYDSNLSNFQRYSSTKKRNNPNLRFPFEIYMRTPV